MKKYFADKIILSSTPVTSAGGYNILTYNTTTGEIEKILSSGGSGTVTSVSIVAANGFSGSVANPTTSPAITLSLQNANASQSGQLLNTDWTIFNNKQNSLSGTGIVKSTGGTISYLTDNSANWDIAYTDRNKWDGGSTGLSAATGRTSLGATTVGSNIFTSTNPSAIRFLRANADNSVSWLDAATFASAIGASADSNVLHKTGYSTETKSGELVIDSGTPNVSGLKLLQIPTYPENSPSTFVSIPTSSLRGMVKGEDGSYYVVSSGENTVYKVNYITGAYSVFATSLLNSPFGICLGPSNDLFVTNYTTKEIIRINKTTGATSLYATMSLGSFAGAIIFGKDGNFYVTAHNSSVSTVHKVTQAGVTSLFATIANGLMNFAQNTAGDLFITNSSNNTLYKVTLAGVVSTHAVFPAMILSIVVDPFTGDLLISSTNGLNRVDINTGAIISLVNINSGVSDQTIVESNGTIRMCYNSTTIQQFYYKSLRLLTTDVSGNVIKTNYIEDINYIKANSTGFFDLSYLGKQTQKTFLAAPNSVDGNPSFRTILASDIPTLNQNTTGSSLSLASRGLYSETAPGNTRGLTGVNLYEAYTNGYPTTYGNVLHVRGTGANQLLLGWSGTDGVTVDNYIRSKRDNDTGAWSGWAKIITDQNYNSHSPTLTGTGASGTWGINVTGSATKWNNAVYNGDTTRFSGDVNTLGLSGTSGIYNLSTPTNLPSGANHGTLFAFWNTDISTQFYVAYNGSAYWRKSVGTTYAGSTWRTFLDSVNYNAYSSFSGNISTSVTSSASVNLGSTTSNSWGATYPTLFGGSVDKWVMHINPHISYVQNGVNGHTGAGMTGATVRFASDTVATTFWDIGVGTNGVGIDKFSIGRGGANFLDISNDGGGHFRYYLDVVGNLYAYAGVSVGTAVNRTGNLANANAIAIGDTDTGFRQNGDGVLETYANNVKVRTDTSTVTTYTTQVRVPELILTDAAGNNKYRIVYNPATDSLDTIKL